jgi:hypothetical protein
VGGAPAGTSFGRATLTPRGDLRVTGWLADGTPFASASYFHVDETFVIRAALYPDKSAQRGSLRGTIAFTPPAEQAAASGAVTWFKPNRPDDARFPNGFKLTSTVSLSRYQRPRPGERILAFDPVPENGELTFSGGALVQFGQALTLTANNLVAVPPPNTRRVGLRFDVDSGFFSGSFADPIDGKVIRLRGAAFQQSIAGGGFFSGAGATDSGIVVLQRRSRRDQ